MIILYRYRSIKIRLSSPLTPLTVMQLIAQQSPLLLLPFEIWELIFEYLDIPDIDSCSKVNHLFRLIALDPQLLKQRLHQTRRWLNIVYPMRPTSVDLMNRHVLMYRSYLSPIQTPDRLWLRNRLDLLRNRDNLKRRLVTRPTRQELIEKGVVKRGGVFASTLCSLERQKIADVVAGFYQGNDRPTYEAAIKRGIIKEDSEIRKSVRTLIRMFSYWIASDDNPVDATRVIQKTTRTRSSSVSNTPTRAKVLSLKRKLEQMQKSANEPKRMPLKQQRTGVQYGVVATLRQRFAVAA